MRKQLSFFFFCWTVFIFNWFQKKIIAIPHAEINTEITFGKEQYLTIINIKETTVHEQTKHALKLLICNPPTKDLNEKNSKSRTVHSLNISKHIAIA